MSTIGDDPKDMRVDGVGPSRGPSAAEGAEAAQEASAASAAEPTDAAAGVTASGGVDEIAQALGTGAIDAEAAKASLIDEAVRAQLPVGADPALVEEIRAEVAALLESDPVLQQLLK